MHINDAEQKERQTRLRKIGWILALLFILIRTAIGFWLNVPAAQALGITCVKADQRLNIGPADQKIISIPKQGCEEIALSQPFHGDGTPAYDLVLYESYAPKPDHIDLDWIELQVSADGQDWKTAFTWSSDKNSANNSNIASYATDKDGASDNEKIPVSALYGKPIRTGILIDIDQLVPPGDYAYIRIVSPPDSTEAAQVDAIEILTEPLHRPTPTPESPTPISPTPTDTPTNTPVTPTDTPTNTPVTPTDTPTNTPVPPTNTPVPPTNTPVTPSNTPRPRATSKPPVQSPTPVPPSVTPSQTLTSVPSTPTASTTSVPASATPNRSVPGLSTSSATATLVTQTSITPTLTTSATTSTIPSVTPTIVGAETSESLTATAQGTNTATPTASPTPAPMSHACQVQPVSWGGWLWFFFKCMSLGQRMLWQIKLGALTSIILMLFFLIGKRFAQPLRLLRDKFDRWLDR